MSLALNPNMLDVKVSRIKSWYLRAVGQGRLVCGNVDTVGHTVQVIGNTFATHQTVIFSVGTGGVLPAALSVGTLYYVVASGTLIQLSLTSGGAAIAIADAGTAPYYVQAADGGFYSLGDLFEGKLQVKTVEQKATKGINRAYGATLTASAKMFDTSKTKVLKTLDKLSTSYFDQVINIDDGAITSDGLADPIFGLLWEFVVQKGLRYLQISADREIDASELTALLTTAAPSYGSQVSTDALYLLATLLQTEQAIAGFRDFQVCQTYNGSFMSIGDLTNYKLSIKLIPNPKKNQLGMSIPFAVQITGEVEAFQASQTELAQQQALVLGPFFVKIPLLGDGTVITLGNVNGPQAGIGCTFNNDTDSTGNSNVVYAFEGIVDISELDNIFV